MQLAPSFPTILCVLTLQAAAGTPHPVPPPGATRRGLPQFDRQIVDAHEQTYPLSCIPSSVELVLKLMGRVPTSYYELQGAWKDKWDGNFREFDGKTFAGVTFRHQFNLARNSDFPLEKLFEAIRQELQAGRLVIVGLANPGGWHNWVIYEEDAEGEFLAISKHGRRTLEKRDVKAAITRMQGTDLGTCEFPTSPMRLPSEPPRFGRAVYPGNGS